MGLFSIFVLFVVFGVNAGESNSEALTCLQEFRIPELLKIKRSLDKVTCDGVCLAEDGQAQRREDSGEVARNDSDPYSLPLIQDRSGWEPEKPTKLQSIFQISITALSFLSFGGYLLCLIVQAIKSKGTTYFHPVATATTATGAGGTKRIKIYRRHRRGAEKRQKRGQRRHHTNKVTAWPDPLEMHNILKMFAEGYVKLAREQA